ncbi:hypothetical protein [Amycolatopsis sp. NPDC004079]|uniref:hypothetical protein n=1 Tax=Amycolatopsis sp. NPDC004079 TaxID=3154549 RepID=UPI0033BD5C91
MAGRGGLDLEEAFVLLRKRARYTSQRLRTLALAVVAVQAAADSVLRPGASANRRRGCRS